MINGNLLMFFVRNVLETPLINIPMNIISGIECYFEIDTELMP
jgi:hypothetical protein